MITKIFSMYDSKVEAYNKPFHQTTKGEALRTFIDAVNDERSPMSKHPEDYSLFQIGEFDDQTGKYTSNEKPVHIANAHEFVRKDVRQDGRQTEMKVV